MTRTPAPILAIWTAPRWRERDGLEFLRIVAALVAYERDVRLIECGAGRGVLASDDLSAEAERYLEAIAASGVVPTALDDEELVAAVREGAAIVRLGAVDRSGEPALLEVGPEASDARALRHAGQVIHARSP